MTLAAPYLLFLGDETDPMFTKTAVGIAHWRREACVGVWRLGASTPGGEELGLPQLTPEAAVAAGARTAVVGVVNSGGFLPSHWITALRQALAAGLDLASGLHTRLHEIEILVADAARFGRRMHDVRDPAADIPVGTGAARTGRRLLTVGTDCAVGKMFTALAIEAELRRRGLPATFRATGQTGILIAGGGVPIDAVVSDFVSGAAEALTPAAAPDHWDVVEGQGSLFHPSFAAVTLGLLHGARPDSLVLCHAVGRTEMVGTAGHRLPGLDACREAYRLAAGWVGIETRVVGVSLNTSALQPEAAAAHIEAVGRELGLPVVDPVRTGVGALVDGLAAG